MRKIFMLCLAGALALAAASCKEDKKVVTLQTITVSGQMYEVKSAFYTENPAEEGGEAGFMLGLFPTVLTTIPEEEPSFYVGIEIPESLCGKTIDLTAKEYDLIELLMRNPRRVYSRENLMNVVWGYTYAGDYRTVDVHIRRLREKLEENPAEPDHILTKWGVGYYFKG